MFGSLTIIRIIQFGGIIKSQTISGGVKWIQTLKFALILVDGCCEIIDADFRNDLVPQCSLLCSSNHHTGWHRSEFPYLDAPTVTTGWCCKHS